MDPHSGVFDSTLTETEQSFREALDEFDEIWNKVLEVNEEKPREHFCKVQPTDLRRAASALSVINNRLAIHASTMAKTRLPTLPEATEMMAMGLSIASYASMIARSEYHRTNVRVTVGLDHWVDGTERVLEKLPSPEDHAQAARAEKRVKFGSSGDCAGEFSVPKCVHCFKPTFHDGPCSP